MWLGREAAKRLVLGGLAVTYTGNVLLRQRLTLVATYSGKESATCFCALVGIMMITWDEAFWPPLLTGCVFLNASIMEIQPKMAAKHKITGVGIVQPVYCRIKFLVYK